MRAFGTVISGNRRKNDELSPYTRSAIISALANVFHMRAAHPSEPPTPKHHSKCDKLQLYISTTMAYRYFSF
jgi:hypothetical protein